MHKSPSSRHRFGNRMRPRARTDSRSWRLRWFVPSWVWWSGGRLWTCIIVNRARVDVLHSSPVRAIAGNPHEVRVLHRVGMRYGGGDSARVRARHSMIGRGCEIVSPCVMHHRSDDGRQSPSDPIVAARGGGGERVAADGGGTPAANSIPSRWNPMRRWHRATFDRADVRREEVQTHDGGRAHHTFNRTTADFLSRYRRCRLCHGGTPERHPAAFQCALGVLPRHKRHAAPRSSLAPPPYCLPRPPSPPTVCDASRAPA